MHSSLFLGSPSGYIICDDTSKPNLPSRKCRQCDASLFRKPGKKRIVKSKINNVTFT